LTNDKKSPSIAAVLGELSLSKTLGTRTAEEIRRRVLSMAPGFRPGDRLYLHTLAGELGVSTTPVREALNLLAADGLVELLPRRGARVVRPSEDDLDDLVAVRSGLEMLAVRLARGRIDTHEAVQLTEYLESCARAIEANDIPAWHANDESFHRALVAASHSRRLLDLYDTLLAQAQLVMASYTPYHPEMLRESLAEHRELVRQLAKGDARLSEKALSAHWDNSRRRLSRKYRDYADARAPDVAEPKKAIART
jgi:DNA-binding GntR family transcriptional regulator